MPKLDTSFGKLPLSFERNDGQTDGQVKFLARGRGYTLFLTHDEAVITLRARNPSSVNRDPKDRELGSVDGSRITDHGSRETINVVRMRLEGANPSPRASGLEPLPGIVNYFIGSDPKKWRTNIPTYKKVEYKEVYPGIDLAYYGNQGKLEYDLVVSPGADPNQIKLAFDGADKIEVDAASGDLILTLASSEQRIANSQEPVASKSEQHATSYQLPATLRLQKPLVYQLDDKGHKTLVAGNYLVPPESPHASRLTPDVRFEVASFDRTKPLIIDPVLFYAGYIGGSDGAQGDQGQSIAVDAAGNAYITGFTDSSQATFPAAVGPDLTHNGDFDAFVAKVKADGTGLVYAGYIGGNGLDRGFGIAVDAAGHAYVTGRTTSSEASFPVTVGPDLTFGGVEDAFVAKVTADGSGLDYAGYIGGNSNDAGLGIAVDAAGRAYVTGVTQSSETSFPVTVGPDLTFSGVADAFVAKVMADGSGFDYAGYIGGAGGGQEGTGIAVDAAGNAYITGDAASTFPVTVGPDLIFNGGILDAFVAKVKADGTGLVYAGYIGGNGNELGNGIAVDTAGNAYVTGRTTSPETSFPVIVGPDLTHNGGDDAFVAKVKADGSGLDYAGYIGGTNLEEGFDIAVDAAGNAYVTGQTLSSAASFPVTGGPDLTFNGPVDAFVAKVNANGSGLNYASYIGGNGFDTGNGIAVDAAGNAYVTGQTTSSQASFPVTIGPDLSLNVGPDAFVAKICNDPPPGTTPGTWSATANSMSTIRGSHAAARLANGKALVAGGRKGVFALDDILNSTELYDSSGNSFSATGAMKYSRFNHSATLLPDGRVLIAGGIGQLAPNTTIGGTTVNTAELYDPVTGTFSDTTGSMTTTRERHTATLLPNGKVLLAGGQNASVTPVNTVELFDPTTGLFTAIADTMASPRTGHAATLLPDGRVLIAAGQSSSAAGSELNTAEIFDPATNTFTTVANTMVSARTFPQATLLSNGQVLITGGSLDSAGGPLNTAELFNPATETFTATADTLTSTRIGHRQMLLPNGLVQVAGGRNASNVRLSSAELYDPAADDFSATGSMGTARVSPTLTLLPDGQVLAAGGLGPSGNLATAEVYTPELCVAAAGADFTLTPTPSSRTVVQGQSTSYTISLTAQNGFSSLVSLSVTSVLPDGVSASFSPDAVTPPGSATLIVSTSGTTPAATSTITIQGTGDSQTNGTSVDLTVNAPGGGAALLALTPTTATVQGGSQVTFGATGGTGPYTFSLMTNQSGGSITSAGLYTAGATAGTDTILVADFLSATVETTVMVTAADGAVDVSLDGRALAALGPAQTFNVFASSGGTFLVGLTTDRVHDLKLSSGPYTLTAGASSLDFSVGTTDCTVTLP